MNLSMSNSERLLAYLRRCGEADDATNFRDCGGASPSPNAISEIQATTPRSRDPHRGDSSSVPRGGAAEDLAPRAALSPTGASPLALSALLAALGTTPVSTASAMPVAAAARSDEKQLGAGGSAERTRHVDWLSLSSPLIAEARTPSPTHRPPPFVASAGRATRPPNAAAPPFQDASLTKPTSVANRRQRTVQRSDDTLLINAQQQNIDRYVEKVLKARQPVGSPWTAADASRRRGHAPNAQLVLSEEFYEKQKKTRDQLLQGMKRLRHDVKAALTTPVV